MTRAPYKPRESGSLKEAVAQLVMACGGQREAAGLTRVSPAQMARYTDDSEDNTLCNMPVDIVRVLEHESGRPIVTRYLAAIEGRALLDLELPILDVTPAEKLAHVAEKSGKLLADAARALEHNRFDPKRAPLVRKECLEAMAAITALLDGLPAVAR